MPGTVGDDSDTSVGQRHGNQQGLTWHRLLPCVFTLTVNLLFGCVAVAYSGQTFPVTICMFVYLWVCLSVCPLDCGKMPERIRMPFGTVGRTGLGMRQVGL